MNAHSLPLLLSAYVCMHSQSRSQRSRAHLYSAVATGLQHLLVCVGFFAGNDVCVWVHSVLFLSLLSFGYVYVRLPKLVCRSQAMDQLVFGIQSKQNAQQTSSANEFT